MTRDRGEGGASWRRYVGLLPSGLLFGGFFLVPLTLIVLYSFWRVVDYQLVPDWTFENYRYFLSVPVYAQNFGLTILVTLISTLVAVLMAFPFAFWLVRYVSKRWQLPLLVMVIIPLWTSYLLRIYAWTSVLGREGAINRFLQWVGLTTEPVSFFLYDRPAVALVLVYLYFPFAALILYTALESFDWDQLKSAMDLGSNPLRAVQRVMLPQIRPAITTAFILVSIPILGEYLVPQLIGGVRGLMIGNLITNFFTGAQYARGAAIALLIVLLIVAVLVLFRRSLEITGTPTRTPAASAMQFESRSGTILRRLFHLYGGSVYLFLFAPIALLVLFSFNANRIGTFPITGWTLDWYQDVFTNSQIQDAFWTSLRVAGQVTLLAVFVGVSAAFVLVRANVRFRDGLRVFLTLPIMIPGLLIGVSLLAMFTTILGVPLTSQTAVIGQTVFVTPFVILVVGARLQSFDRMLESAANDLGADWLRRLRHVVLPILFPSLLASAILAFTLSIDEFIITLFLIGGYNTLPMYVYTQLRFGITPEVNALATLLLAGSFTLVAASLVIPTLYQRIRARSSFRRVSGIGELS